MGATTEWHLVDLRQSGNAERDSYRGDRRRLPAYPESPEHRGNRNSKLHTQRSPRPSLHVFKQRGLYGGSARFFYHYDHGKTHAIARDRDAPAGGAEL